MCPDIAKKDADVILVQEDNVVLCLDLWQKSAIFEFGHVFQVRIKEGQKLTSHAQSKYFDSSLQYHVIFCM